MKIGSNITILWRNNMEIITTSKNNKYLYEEETGFLSLLCGDLGDNLKENKVSLIDEKKTKISGEIWTY